ncbi:MAG: hypothetical protein O7A06_07865 [Acidobacteria bacterium]|nr:hypothetical protein [Acidobacteriota bacterium]
MGAMTLLNLLLDAGAAAAGLGAAVLLFKRLPLISTFVDLNSTVYKAFHVIGARGISDHWKELVLSRYALKIMIGSSCSAVYLLAIVGGFVAGFIVVQLPFVDTPQSALARLLRWEPNLTAVVMGIFLSFASRRKGR